MTSRRIAFLLSLVAVPFSWSCHGGPAAPWDEPEEAPTPVTGPTAPHPEVLLRPAFLSLHLGEEARFVLTVGPAQEPLDTSEAGVEWHSTHPEVVEVTAEGVVRALGKGRARIRAVGADFMVSATVRVR